MKGLKFVLEFTTKNTDLLKHTVEKCSIDKLSRCRKQINEFRFLSSSFKN